VGELSHICQEIRDLTPSIKRFIEGDVQQGFVCPYEGRVWSSNGLVKEINELTSWVEHNEPERWAQLKFMKERWDRLNNNAMERWNKGYVH